MEEKEKSYITHIALMTMDNVITEMAEAETKAWDSLGRYKFLMFGYHAAQWVLLNQVSGLKKSNPFKDLVQAARERKGE